MKQLLNEKRAFLVVLAFLILCFLFLLKPVLIALILAAILTVLLYPVYTALLRIVRGRKYVASFLATFLIFLILVLPAGLVTALIVNEVANFVSGMDVQGFLSSLVSLDFYRETVQPLLKDVEARFNISVDLAGLLTRVASEAARYVTDFSPQVLVHTAAFFFNFFVMHVSVYFLFIEGRTVLTTLLDLSPLKSVHEKRLVGEFKNMIYATVYGYLFTALVQGVLSTLGFWVAGVQAPLVFGTLTFFMSMVPIVGATAVWAPVAIWLLVQGNTGWGIFLGAYGLVVISGIDNVVKPWLMRGKAKIHILLIFFSLIGGIRLLGPIGILVGPVITALLLACIRIYREEFLKAGSA